MCSFLHRNLRKCSVETKDMAYRSLEYSSPVWDSATKSESDKIEKVQRKEARFVCNDYRRTSSVSSMITSLEWPNPQQRRKCAKVIMIHTCIELCTAL